MKGINDDLIDKAIKSGRLIERERIIEKIRTYNNPNPTWTEIIDLIKEKEK